MSKTRKRINEVISAILAMMLLLFLGVTSMVSLAADGTGEDGKYTVTLEDSKHGVSEFEIGMPEDGRFDEGETVTFRLVADTGYMAGRVDVLDADSGQTVDSLYPDSDVFSFIMPAEDLVIQTVYTEREAGISTLASSSSNVYLEIGTSISYGNGWGTHHMYTGDSESSASNIAYCVEPSKQAPGSGMTTKLELTFDADNDYGYSLDMLRAALWFSYGCPGFDKSLWPSDYYETTGVTSDQYVVMAHLLLSKVYLGDSKDASAHESTSYYNWMFKNVTGAYSNGANEDSTWELLKQRYKEVPDDSVFHVFLMSPDGSSKQTIIGWEYNPTGYLELKKSSANTSITKGNSCYDLEGATYTVYEDKSCSSTAKDANGDKAKLTCDSDGNTETLEMEAGTYYVKETKAGKGYELDETVYSVTVESGETATVAVKDEPLYDSGGIKIYKVDAETGEPDPQGDASLAGAEFTVKFYAGDYSQSEIQDMTPTKTWTLTTKEVSGEYVASLTDDLPLGTYTIQETKAPTGYLIKGDLSYKGSKVASAGDVFYTQLLDEGEAVWVTGGNEYTGTDTPIRGGVEIQKRDLESYRADPQGNASFEGITLEITNKSKTSVVVDGVEYDPGKVVMTLVTDETGYAVTAADALPYGSYTITETETSEGYLLGNDSHTDISQKAVLSIDFTIRTDGKIVDLTGGGNSDLEPEEAITDLVKRGDIALVKQDGENQSTDLGSIPFRITSQTTGESHVFWTDENGDYSSDSTWNKHTYKTNLGEDDTDGIWFFGYADWEEANLDYVDDALGALPYDRYDLDELPCDNNEGMELIHTSFRVSRDIRVINLGTLDNYPEPEAEIGTTLINDWTGEHQATIFENQDISLTDTVEYSGLTAGETYTVAGVLMDKETGEPLLNHEGEEVWAETTFTAEDTDGIVEVTYVFDANGLHGTETVAFEYLYDAEGRLIASHEDIDDVDQTVELLLPTLWTYAAETLSGRKAIEASDDVSITDMLYLTGLIPEHTYYVYGKAVDPETGEMILDHDGNPLEMTMEFVADAEEMTLDIMQFHFNASDLAGKSVVFEEYLYADADRTILITEEEDLGSPEQTVYFFGDVLLGTTLLDEETDSHIAMADDHVTLTDMVEYEGAIVGETYTMTGTLMDHETGLAVTDKDGNEITAQSEPFTAEEGTGVVEITFEFDASDLVGDSVVAYEFMYNSEGTLVGAHEDINDEGQTVTFPEIGTTLLDENTESHEAIADESIVLIDTVAYEGLIPGDTYHLTGMLMNKETGEELTDADGNPVTAEAEFTAEDAEGTAEVTFTFNGSSMEGVTTVAYEYLFDVNGNMVASHEDLDDEAQTVDLVPKEAAAEQENETPSDTPTTLSSGSSGRSSTPKTGDTTNVGGWIALGFGGLAAVVGTVVRIRRRKGTGSK